MQMSDLRRVTLLSAFVRLLGMAIMLLPAGYNLEEGLGLSLLFGLRGEITAPKDVVIVAIDEASAMDLQLPRDSRFWSRSWYANLVHRLIDEGASVIAFDLMFSMERSLEEDLDFAAAIREAGNVLLLSEMRRETIILRDVPILPDSRMIIETMIPPIETLKREALYIAPFQLPKYPGKVSQYWLFKHTADVVTLPGAALQLHALQAFDDLKALLGRALDNPSVARATDPLNQSAHEEARWILGLDTADLGHADTMNRLVRAMRQIVGADTLIARNMIRGINDDTMHWPSQRRRELLGALLNMYKGGGARYLNFYGPPRTITTVPFSSIVHNGTERKADLPDFRDKAVFVGVSDIGTFSPGDTFRTVFTTGEGLDLSGVEIAATAFANLLDGQDLKPLAPALSILLVGVFGLIAAMSCYVLGPFMAALAVANLGAVYLGVAYWWFLNAEVWYPVIVPLAIQIPVAFIGALVWKYIEARRLEIEHAHLTEINRVKSQFVSHVSHELKTPLTSIKGLVDNMTSGFAGDISDKQRDYLSRIHANADRLTRMISDLLDVSRIESGTLQLHRVQAKPCSLIQDCLAQFQLQAEAKGVEMEIVCADREVTVWLDPDKFTQVITNLVDNALKHTDAGGVIRISLGNEDPEHISVTVADTGEGIPQDYLDTLFEPFSRASRRAGYQKGLGLGLSIVKYLIDLHDGTIAVASEVGKGTEFRVVLPLTAGEGPGAQQPA
jgi:signal transduction histidine kinase